MPPRRDDEMGDRVSRLEDRMTRVEKTVDSLNESINGSGEKPGLFEMMRATQSCASDTKAIVQKLQADRWIIRGVVVAVSAMVSVGAWLLGLLLKN